MVHGRLIILFLLVCFSVQSQQKIDRFTRFAGESDPILALSPDFYYNNTSIDTDATIEDDAIDLWEDISGNGDDAVMPNSDNEPRLHLEGADRQVDGFANDFLWVDDTSVGEYTLGTDEFSIVIREGESLTDNNGVLVGKGVATSADRLWVIYRSGSDTNILVNHGGTATTFTNAVASGNRTIMVVFSTTQVSCFIDNVEAGNSPVTLDTSSGDNSSQRMNIFARTDGGFVCDGCQLDLVAGIPSALTSGNRSDIQDFWGVN